MGKSCCWKSCIAWKLRHLILTPFIYHSIQIHLAWRMVDCGPFRVYRYMAVVPPVKAGWWNCLGLTAAISRYRYTVQLRPCSCGRTDVQLKTPCRYTAPEMSIYGGSLRGQLTSNPVGEVWNKTDSDPVYMSRKIRKFRTDKFDTWNKRKFCLMQLM